MANEPTQIDIAETSASKQTPPPSPPPDVTNELRPSRKRERSQSYEPGTPKLTADDVEPNQIPKEPRVPTKKNRVHLDATEEESDPVAPTTPPQGTPPDLDHSMTSPAHEVKVRQISQGVNEIKMLQKERSQSSAAMESVQEGGVSQENQDVEVLDASAEDETSNAAGESAEPSMDAVEAEEASFEDDANDQKPMDEEPIEHVALATVTSAPPSPNSAKSPNCESKPGLISPPESDTEQEKSRKRKLSENALGGSASGAIAAVKEKRLRDDANEDANPRDRKRKSPSPPPEDDQSAEVSADKPIYDEIDEPPKPSTPPPSTGGFAAYASASPFAAAAQGPSLFGSTKTTNGTSALSKQDSTTFTATEAVPSSHSTPSFGGFSSFASTASPFASVSNSPMPVFGERSTGPLNGFRSKSPPGSTVSSGAAFTAFSSYASGASGFAIAPKSKVGSNPLGSKGEDEDEGGGEEDEDDNEAETTFSDKLRAKAEPEEKDEDEETKQEYTMLDEVTTGEEDEETVHQCRGKLYALDKEKGWLERGVGQIRLNVRLEDGRGARLVMRKEAVYTLLLNVPLFKGMKAFTAQDPRYIRFSAFEKDENGNDRTVHFNLRVSNGKVADDLVDAIAEHLPLS